MIANSLGREAVRLATTFPGRIGHLYGPGGWKTPRPAFPYALDNGAFPAWRAGRELDVAEFRAHVARAAAAAIPPRWVAVPDVVCDRDRTLASWRQWEPELRRYGWPLAFVVQNGMTARDVPSGADVVFVGGDTTWKRETAPLWCRDFPRVHIGRVNTERWLWRFAGMGAESCDGSGWFRGRRAQLDGLWYFLTDTTPGARELESGAHQTRLPFAS